MLHRRRAHRAWRAASLALEEAPKSWAEFGAQESKIETSGQKEKERETETDTETDRRPTDSLLCAAELD